MERQNEKETKGNSVRERGGEKEEIEGGMEALKGVGCCVGAVEQRESQTGPLKLAKLSVLISLS